MTGRVDELAKTPGTEPFTTEFLREHLDERFINGGLLFDQWFLAGLWSEWDEAYDEGYQDGYDAGYSEGYASAADQDDPYSL